MRATAPLAELSPTELGHTRDDENCLHNIVYVYIIYIYIYAQVGSLRVNIDSI